ncbi:hypothetical protein [Streptomyces sp. NPDC017086]|uniref:hypothetical protein n=1 Tax=Streptomyces sp. NPDC017086 TaxID=3364976 RepID=UPI00379BDA8D
MSEYGFARASEDVVALRNELADQVVRALREAGLPAFREGESDEADRAGAVVVVDPDAVLGSAPVSVAWTCSPDTMRAAVESLVAGRPDAPAVRYPGTIGRHMQAALIGILLSAGILATLENDHMHPDRVLVFGLFSDLPPALRPAFVRP